MRWRRTILADKQSYIVASIARIIVLVHLFLVLPAAPVSAAIISVSGGCTFEEAIANANNNNNGNNNGCATGSGADLIELTGDVALAGTNALSITSSLTINGNSYKISGGRASGLIVLSGSISVTINNVTMTNSVKVTSAGGNGGAIRVNSGANLTIDDSTFTGNSAETGGGAIYVERFGGNLTVNDSAFSNNAVTHSTDTYSAGGAIFYEPRGNTLTISNSSFSGNNSNFLGGAVFAFGIVNIRGSTFSNNSAGRYGGAISLSSHFKARLTVSNSVFTANSALDAGAIQVFAPESTVKRSAFNGNTASRYGGAFTVSGALVIENSSFYNNRAYAQGGALFLESFGGVSATVRHATFVNNSSNNDGKTIYAGASQTLNLYNSIISSSVDGDDCVNADVNVRNIIQDGSCSTPADFSVNPQLAVLTGNVYPLSQGSPAIDAADDAACNALSEAVDQLGVTRPVGSACDIGAYEGFITPAPKRFDSPAPKRSGSDRSDRDEAAHDEAALEEAKPRVITGEALMASSDIRVRAQYGLGSGIQFQRRDHGAVGIPSVIDRGVVDVVDVWGYAEQDWEICFPQSGSLVFIDAANIPRVPAPMAAHRDEAGYTCVRGNRAGMVVLNAGASSPAGQASAPAEQAASPAGQASALARQASALAEQAAALARQASAPAELAAALERQAAALAELAAALEGQASAPAAKAAAPVGPASTQSISNCMVTTQAIVNFRKSPGGERLHYVDPWGYQVAGLLPYDVTLTALARTADWFKVDYYGTQGWVSADHVSPQGNCG